MKTELMGMLAAAALLSGATVWAEEGTAELRAKLQAAYPATDFGAIAPSVVPGLYEVQLGRNIAYIEREGRYFFFGHIYDMQAQADLTAERKDDLMRIDVAALPPADAFVSVTGAGPAARTVVLFSDPLCGYCKALEQTLQVQAGLTVRVYLLPLQIGSAGVAARIWCAPDRATAWNDFMRDDVAPAPAGPDCDTGALDRNAALAKRLGIAGTPTLISEDGRIQPGAVSAEALTAWLGAPSVTMESQR